MAAKLPPGGRLVNYDPQTYSSYPGSPQGVPDLNIIPGLPSVSGYASIVNGNYESTTHTHEQDDLDIGQLSSGMLGRLDLREVVTVPEYFLVPLQTRRASFDDFTQIPEDFGSDPVLARGFGADYNDTAYPFDPGPRPALGAGADGLMVLRGVPRARHRHPCPGAPAPARQRLFASGRCWRTGRPVGARRPRARGRQHGDRPSSGRRRDRTVGPGAGRLTPVAARGDLRGRAPLRAGGLAVVGAGARAVATGRVSRRATPCSPSASRPSRSSHRRRAAGDCRCSVLSSTTKSEEIRLRRAGAVDGDPLRRVGLRVERHRLRRRGQGPEHPGQ